MHQTACHECDLLQHVPDLQPGASARCLRCGSLLFRHKADSINRTLAWTLAGMVLFLVAVTFPFLGMESGGIKRHTALLTGIMEIYRQGMLGLACLVLLTCVVVPLVQMIGLFYVYIPLKLNRRAPFAMQVFRLFQHLQPWSMMEVFMLGILVSLVKLGKMATIVPGLAVFAFALLIFALTFAVSSVDSHLVWERLEDKS
ncbi:MAG: paraquat-inducible protein A [Desulfuromonas sp.]|uniref:paraquat-inducible protein A n=1 Tax=Desulfuromonas sp. TaxID=892 RepID=UPI000CAC76D5|nr:paraquat-inducible protein A [Desulfuromonas sp.]PLX85057.1 MAG: paraquat-inducible protein A [Desulfuromonas sp.]